VTQISNRFCKLFRNESSSSMIKIRAIHRASSRKRKLMHSKDSFAQIQTSELASHGCHCWSEMTFDDPWRLKRLPCSVKTEGVLARIVAFHRAHCGQQDFLHDLSIIRAILRSWSSPAVCHDRFGANRIAHG